jgi:hypothetical protein
MQQPALELRAFDLDKVLQTDANDLDPLPNGQPLVD